MTSAPQTTASPLRPTQQRLGSIDAYRGLVMFLMMAEVLRLSQVAKAFPTSKFWAFLAHHQSHVPWAGCSLHDLIQPSFSFLVGVSLPFSLARRDAKGQSHIAMIAHAVFRAIVLVLLGVFLRSMSAKQTNWTFEDTLSQIGFGYVPLVLLGFTRQRWQWLALVVILVGYWGAFALYPLPPSDFDYQKVGVPADWQHHYSGLAAHWNKNSNLAWRFDTWLLNLFPRPKPFEFNGGGYATLSFIPTLGTMILGLIAGGWLLTGGTGSWPASGSPVPGLHKPEAPVNRPGRTIGLMVLTGAVLMALGLAADHFGICPSVKRIWTPAWTLFSGGWCFFFLAAFYALIDLPGWYAWSFPLRVIGANSIAAYLLAHGPDRFIKDSLQLHFGPKLYSMFGEDYKLLVAGGLVLLVEWLILYWMYQQRIHVRI
jgi:heparan-alpha-glucosaminide N-acetyltransferase